MSPLWLTFILNAALATESQVSVPAEVAQLEAAVLAKYSGETPSGAEPTSNASQEVVTTPATDASATPADVPPEVAQLEAAVLAKYSGETPSGAEPTSVANQEAITTPSTDASATPADVPPEVAKLEAAVLAKYGENAPQETTTSIVARSKSGLNVRKLHEPKVDSEPVVVAILPTWQQSSSLSFQGFEELMQAGNGCVDQGQCTVLEDEEEPAPEKRSKFSLFSQGREEEPKAPLSAETVEAEPAAAEPVPKKKQPMVMHDLPGYKHHGAHMVHVETSTERKSPSGPLKQEEAEKLAKRREEVEDVFHSRTERIESSRVMPDAPPAKRPTSAAWSFFRTLFFLALLLSGAAVAYHKFAVLVSMSEGRRGFKSFKAKCEDACDFGAGAGFQQHMSGGVSSMMPGAGMSFSRRGAPDLMSSEFGV